ncbi:MAG: tetratricopeptide repeat protein [Chthoniobacteraceae bacterium]
MGAPTEEIQPEIAPSDLQRVQDLYDRALYVRAYEVSREFGPLDQWHGTAARILAGRLAANLGNQRLREWQHIQAFRFDRENYEAAYYYAWRKLERRGPLAAWDFLEGINSVHTGPDVVRAHALALQGRIAGCFRDFETADALLKKAEEIVPVPGWVQIEKSMVLQQKDEHGEALAVLESTRDVGETYRSNVQYSAEILLMLNRDSDALNLLMDASGKIESAAVFAQLSTLQMEMNLHAEALHSLERMEALSPLPDKAACDWLESRRSDAYYHLGDYGRAGDHAGRLDNAFYKRIAENLKNPAGKRVHLDVGFVRQHHDTCAPATLAALAKFWGRPVDHVDLAREICYGGTPDHRERNWAELNGWVAREFEVTLECAHQLLDRGIPFTLTTTGPVSGHLQAVIGYDSIRGILILRDPSLRIHGEVAAEEFLKAFASSGPRGMVIIPAESAHLLDGVELPHADLYDCYYRLRRALHGHDRPGAEGHFLESQRIAPKHRMTLLAKRTVAHYDSNQIDVLSSIEEALEEFPDDGLLLLWKGITLRNLTRRAEYLDFLRELCARKKQDPVFWREYAQALGMDARQSDAAFKLLHRAILGRPYDADNLSELANLFWSQRDFAKATQLYRFAACLAETNENYSQSYFTASRHLRETDRALDFLQRRRKKFEGLSSWPERTLYWAYSRLGLLPEAFQLLDEALEKRPVDGELILFASDAHGRYGRYERAGELLQRAESCSQRTAWLRQKAELAGYLGNLDEALGLWKEVLEVEPLAEDAHRSVARLLAETEDRGSAIAHLRSAGDRFPHNIPLQKLLLEWLTSAAGDSYESVLGNLIKINPDDAWARREMAIFLGSRGRIDEAFAEAELALKLEPNSAYSHTTRAHVCKNAGMLPETGKELRQALSLAVDTSFAMTGLLEICQTLKERREALDFIKQELIRQVVFGDALLTFRDVAYPILEQDDLLAWLHEAMHARPDLWHAWSAVAGQLTDMGRTEDALLVATEATARFPLVPRVWSDLATVHESRRERAEQIAALQQGLQINPHWGLVSRKLSRAQENGGDPGQARATLELAVARDPLDCANHGMLADILWKNGAKADALLRMEHALRLYPGYSWGWNMFLDWTKECGNAGRPAEFARELAQSRAGDAQIWYVLAQYVPDIPGRLEAVDKAIALSPNWIDAHDLRAMLLAEAGRVEEAIQACNHASWRGHPPVELMGREAWLVWRQGRKTDAKAKMLLVTSQSPGYYWGWSVLADWAREQKEKKDYLNAARQMVRLAPRNAIAHGYVADASLALGDMVEAKASMFKAMQMDPSYVFASGKLLELQINAGEAEAASATLGSIRKHIGGWHAAESEARFSSAKQRDKKGALEALRKLCGTPVGYTSCLNNALLVVDKAGWKKDADEILQQSLFLDGTNPEVGEIWVLRWTNAGKWGMRKQLYPLVGRGEIAIRAFAIYANILGEKIQKPLLGKLVKKHGEWLRKDVRMWGTVGYAMTNCKDYKSAIGWMRDWGDRPDAQPWMLSNLTTSLLHHRRYDEAAVLNHAALKLKNDHTTSQFQLWLALETALTGDEEEASRFLKDVGDAKLAPYFNTIREMATGVIKVRNTPENERRQAYHQVRKEWNRTIFPQVRSGARTIMRDYFRRSIKRIARDAKTWAGFNFPSFQFGGTSASGNNKIPFWLIWIAIIVLFNVLKSCS